MRKLLLGFVVWLTGCASINPAECRSAYDIGFRDAIFGLQKQDNVYALLCEQQGAQLDLAGYARGWQEGYYEFERRKIHGGTD
jgi:uncharacterized protein YceK